MHRSLLWTTAALGLLVAPLAAAQDDDWCREGGWGGRARHCEVREVALGTVKAVAVDANPNGGIRVEGTDAPEARLWVKVEAQAPTEEEAREIAGVVQVRTAGTIRANGPRNRSGRHWSASYRLQVPRGTDLDLVAGNGGIRVEGTKSKVRFETTNGGVRLARLNGDVRGRTTNGGVHVDLDGAGWEGAGLEAITTNGGVKLSVSEGYRGRLETGTVNGRLEVDFPVTLQGRIGRSLELDLGGGGPPLRVRTTNGSVRVQRSER